MSKDLELVYLVAKVLGSVRKVCTQAITTQWARIQECDTTKRTLMAAALDAITFLTAIF